MPIPVHGHRGGVPRVGPSALRHPERRHPALQAVPLQGADEIPAPLVVSRRDDRPQRAGRRDADPLLPGTFPFVRRM